MNVGEPANRRGVAGAAWLLLFAFISTGGCGGRQPGTDGPVVYDFVESFSQAHFEPSTEAIDFGTVKARQYLLSGWSRDRRRRDGTRYVEGRGVQSLLEFSWGRASDLEVRLGLVPIGARAISLDLNRKHSERIDIRAGKTDYGVVFPSAAVVRGKNRLRLRYDYGPKHPSRSYRSIAFEMERMRLGTPGARADQEPRVDPATHELTIPVGAHIDYDLEVEGGSVLTFRGPLKAGGSGARLAVVIQRDGEEELEVARLGASDARRSVVMPVHDRRIVRLSFRALAAGGQAGGGGEVTLARPVMRAPRSDAEEVTLATRRRRIGGGKPWPNIIVYLIDTLRADHLGCYGYASPVSPHIDAFARDAVLFEHAIAQSSWTKPSVASLFTGVWPGTHRVVEEGQELPDEALTLAEILARAGLLTAAFVANGHVGAGFGFAQGFDYFEMVLGKNGNQIGPPPRSDMVNRHVFRWLEQNSAKAPFFLYVHTVDPHSPYEPTSGFRWRFASGVDDPDLGSVKSLTAIRQGKVHSPHLIDDLIALYDAGAAFNDERFGSFIERLRHLGIYDDSLVIFLADHGEAFHEHGTWQHANNLYTELIHIPFLIKFPARDGVAGLRVGSLAQHVDILPTLLDYLGLRVPAGLEGGSLLGSLLNPDAGNPDAGAFPARTGFAHLDKNRRRQVAAVHGRWKLLRAAGTGRTKGGFRFRLYDRLDDPGERQDVIAAHPIVAAYLKAKLAVREQTEGPMPVPATRDLDDVTRENLRALGYVD